MTDETPPDRKFRDGLAEGRILLQRCTDCDKHIFFPRVLCPVYTTTIIRRKPERGGDYNLCMVDMAEGVRMMSRVDGIAPDAVKIGMAVKAHVGEIDGAPAVLFNAKEG